MKGRSTEFIAYKVLYSVYTRKPDFLNALVRHIRRSESQETIRTLLRAQTARSEFKSSDKAFAASLEKREDEEVTGGCGGVADEVLINT